MLEPWNPVGDGRRCDVVPFAVLDRMEPLRGKDSGAEAYYGDGDDSLSEQAVLQCGEQSCSTVTHCGCAAIHG